VAVGNARLSGEMSTARDQAAMTTDLNPLAARVSTELAGRHPEFATNERLIDGGDVELAIPAGSGSNAGALVVTTAGGSHIWIRFAPPQMCYAVDNDDELLTIVAALLEDRVTFVHIVDAQGNWSGTTLAAPNASIELQTGERACVRSWSGRFDRELVAESPQP
jgi:hypothetical protein